jgi:hypothetical protein
MKQISKVLAAVEAGGIDSHDVSFATGMSVKTCSAYLSVLCRDGFIVLEMSQRNRRTSNPRGGLACNLYGLRV